MKLPNFVIATVLAFGFSTISADVYAESTTTKTTKTTTNPDGSKTVEETTVTKSTSGAGAEKPVETSEESKEDFKAKVQKQIDSINEQIDSLKKDASTASSDAKVSIEKKIAVLEKKRDDVSADLSKIGDQTGRAWTKFKSGITKAVDELQDGYKSARKEFSKDEAKSDSKAQKAKK